MSDIPPIKVIIGVETEAAVESVKEFGKQVKASIETAFTTSVDRAKAKLDELTRKQKEVVDTLDAEKRKLVELEQKRTEASGSAKKQTEQDIEGLKKVIATRENERIELEKKRLKLQEIGQLAAATNDKEKQGIMEANSARMVELNLLKDSAKAHKQIGEEIQQTIPIGRNFLTVMGGLFLVNQFVGKSQELMAALRKDMEGINAAGEKQRGMSMSQTERWQSFYNEYGLDTGAQQKSAQDSIQRALGGKYDQDTLSKTAATLAPVLNAGGIKPGSEQFNDILGNASAFTSHGIEGNDLAAFVGDMLKKNPQMTGEQINKRLSSIRSSFGGSASRMNTYLNTLATEKTKLRAAGLSDEDVQKMFVKMQEQRVQPQEMGTVAREAFHAMDRMLGLGPEQQIDLQEEANIAGVKGLNPVIQDALRHKGPINIRQALSAMEKMPAAEREKAARTVGGPRGVVALSALAGFEQVKLPAQGPTLGPPDNPDVVAKILSQQSQVSSIHRTPTNPNEAQFMEDIAGEERWLNRHPDEKQGISHGAGYFWSHVPTLGIAGFYTASDQQQAAANVYGDRFMQIARTLADIRSGKISATPSQIAELQKAGDDILKKKLHPFRGRSSTPTMLEQMVHPLPGKPDPMAGITDDMQWFRNTMTYANVDSSIVNETEAAPILQSADKAIQAVRSAPAAAPAPAPAPVAPPAVIPGRAGASINIHQRIINYGSSYDSIGAALESTNRFG